MTLSGLVVVDKPAGVTSHDVVARVRKIAGTKKVGHAGTLDPMATGVLVLGINKATRLLGHLMIAEKTYDATVRLGASTNTDDAEGEVTAQASAADVSEQALREALKAFEGSIQQVPSTVSAIKVGGQRAYKLAREGQDVVLQARTVTIHSLEVSDVRREGDFLDVDITVSCSSGTYIRAIARDLGAALGVGGHLTALRRTEVGPFALEDAPLSLDEMRASGELNLIALPDVGERLFFNIRVDELQAADIGFGRKLDLTLPVADHPVAMLGPDGAFLALYEQQGEQAVPIAVLV
ncbi:MAG TPA: tRNA pseudouridine(55) synthase TruB [Nocardioidaceae bacterium]|nr:tRNA pseudouridine(55) synthase TruB [Nocardioidaceae bacterium]